MRRRRLRRPRAAAAIPAGASCCIIEGTARSARRTTSRDIRSPWDVRRGQRVRGGRADQPPLASVFPKGFVPWGPSVRYDDDGSLGRLDVPAHSSAQPFGRPQLPSPRRTPQAGRMPDRAQPRSGPTSASVNGSTSARRGCRFGPDSRTGLERIRRQRTPGLEHLPERRNDPVRRARRQRCPPGRISLARVSKSQMSRCPNAATGRTSRRRNVRRSRGLGAMRGEILVNEPPRTSALTLSDAIPTEVPPQPRPRRGTRRERRRSPCAIRRTSPPLCACRVRQRMP